MSSILVGRTRARSQAVQLLFQASFLQRDVFDLLADGDYVLEDGPLEPYAEQIARGVARSQLTIDRLLTAVSVNWKLERMPLVDRAMMGVAIHEMFDEEDIPVNVAISEAVELAKVYGTDDSSSFINGVLGRIARLAQDNPGVPLAKLADCATGAADEPVGSETVVPEARDGAAQDAGEADEYSVDDVPPMSRTQRIVLLVVAAILVAGIIGLVAYWGSF